MRSARGPFCLFIRYGFVSSTILRVDGYVQAMLSKPALLTCGVCPVLSSLPAPALPQGCYRVLPSVTITPKGRGARNTCAACRARPLYWRRRQDVARKPPASLRALLAPCPSPRPQPCCCRAVQSLRPKHSACTAPTLHVRLEQTPEQQTWGWASWWHGR